MPIIFNSIKSDHHDCFTKKLDPHNTNLIKYDFLKGKYRRLSILDPLREEKRIFEIINCASGCLQQAWRRSSFSELIVQVLVF